MHQYGLRVYCAYLQKKSSAAKKHGSKVKMIVIPILTGNI